MTYEQLVHTYPRTREPLPPEYAAIYDQHYSENRNGATVMSSVSSKMEEWLHRKVAKTAGLNFSTLEIGAGTLNQLNFETPGKVYDIVEPYEKLFANASNRKYVREVFPDISKVPLPREDGYDRITSVACFEHITDLPFVIQKTTQLLKPSGILCVSIPNEGRFLWKLAYTITTGREFKKRFNLDYEVLMRYEHINKADEIEIILNHFYQDVKRRLYGIGKTFSFYRYYECRGPIKTSDLL